MLARMSGGELARLALMRMLPGGRGDEIDGEVAGADVVEVVGDLEGGDGGGPVGIALGADSRCCGEEDGDAGEEVAEAHT